MTRKSGVVLAALCGAFMMAGCAVTPSSWDLAYEHDASGTRVSGSKADLMQAVRAGKTVRVYVAGADEYTASAETVAITGNETVTAEIPMRLKLRMGGGAPDARAVLTTAGDFTTSAAGADVQQVAARWYVAQETWWSQGPTGTNTGRKGWVRRKTGRYIP